MKKLKVLTLVLALILMFTACAKPANNDIQEDQEQEKNKVDNKTSQEKETNKIKVVASFYPVYDFTKKIGREKIEVINLTQTGSAHGFEPSIEDMKKIVDADLLVINGGGFESWIENVKTNNPNLDIVDMSHDVDLIESNAIHGDEHDHDDHTEEAHDHDDHAEEAHDHDKDDDHAGHSHGKYDPHTWLSLDNAKEMLETIKEKLSEKNPENKGYYQANYDTIKEKIEAIDDKYEDLFEAHKGKSFVVPHKAFGYLAKDYDLEQIGVEGINSDTEPTLTRVGEIVDLMKEHKINTVFYEYGKSDKIAQTIAAELGGNVKPISTLEVIGQGDVDKGNDYLSLMEMNLQNILDSFEGK